MTFVWAIADVHTKRLLIIAFCSGQSTRISYISEAVCGRTVRAVKILSLQASLASVYFLTFIRRVFGTIANFQNHYSNENAFASITELLINI